MLQEPITRNDVVTGVRRALKRANIHTVKQFADPVTDNARSNVGDNRTLKYICVPVPTLEQVEQVNREIRDLGLYVERTGADPDAWYPIPTIQGLRVYRYGNYPR